MSHFISHDTIEGMASEFKPESLVRVDSLASTTTVPSTGISRRTYRVQAQIVDYHGNVHYVRVFTGQVQQFIAHAQAQKTEREEFARASKDTEDVLAAFTTWFERAGFAVRGGQVNAPSNIALIDCKGATFLDADDRGRPCINEPAFHEALAALAAQTAPQTAHAQ